MHSDYSLLDSCTKFSDYVDAAIKNGQNAIASTEHGKPLGWVSKKQYCDQAGIKFIHGVEIYLTENLEPKVRDNFHTVLLAKNWDGVMELNTLVSRSCDSGHFYFTNRISFDEFLSISDNIISTSACLASPLNKLPDNHPRYMELANKYTFLEVQPHNHPEQIEYNKRLLALSNVIGKPLIAGTDTHSITPYKAECRSVIMAAKRKNYGDEDAFDLTFKTYDELVKMFEIQGALSNTDFMQAIDNTNKLYDMCDDFELDKSIKYPILYGTRESDDEHLTELVERKFAEKISSGIIPPEQEAAFRTAIDEEMAVFKKLGMGAFILSMAELLSWCKDRGMAIGTARGSVGGSRVAYVTDIIDLNPETWHTVFSRFCNVDRVEIGDVDIDCVESDRPEIFRHITEAFGADKTARVASFGTLADKSVIDEVGRSLMYKWNVENGRKYDDKSKDNPYNYGFISKVKTEFSADPDKAKEKYRDILYYFDGLVGTKISQSVHPAGMVISPITLYDNYGVFEKDGDMCLMMDMDEAHDVGAAKYDFLILKTVQVIRDTCMCIGKTYPKTYEINWNDDAVWDDMIKSPAGLFQFEGDFAFKSLKKFKPENIFDMSLVTACIRPSGSSYRDNLLQRKIHKNPSEIIDELLANNYGQLVYQEDIIEFLQKICGLSGSEADTVRRGIAKKKIDILNKSMGKILDGYCSKSSKPRDVAEAEAKEFLQVIEDASAYMFGYNHSIAYCLLGYLCAYYRYYNPIEFITSFLNDAANEDDIQNGALLAKQKGIKIVSPKFGISKGDYFYNKEENVIAKGLSSVKYMSAKVADELYNMAMSEKFTLFSDVLDSMGRCTSIDARQLDMLIKIDYFSEFGNQAELFRILEIFNTFYGKKKIKKEDIDGTYTEEIVKKYASWKTKAGKDARSYTILDSMSIIRECENAILSAGIRDIGTAIKIRNYCDIIGGYGYISGKEEDRSTLIITGVFPLVRKKDSVLFAYNVLTHSVGSGIDSRMTVFKKRYDADPIKENDIVVCKRWEKDGKYFRMLDYEHLVF